MKYLLLTLLCTAALFPASRLSLAQPLEPGFRVIEAKEMLLISARYGDSAYTASLEAPARFAEVYRSDPAGLDNMWKLHTDGHSTAVVDVRGSTTAAESWLANIYAGMTPAAGVLRREGGPDFAYQLARHPRAAVHSGWLVALSYLAPGILQHLDSCYRAGYRDLLLTGHSQGGAIAYLLTAYLRSEQQEGRFPADWRIKTYCTAAPKPGNSYFAYDYEAWTAGGWAFNVINAADWVPQVPISLQSFDDMNDSSPLGAIAGRLGEQSLLVRIALKRALRKMDRSPSKAAGYYTRYLGDFAGKQVAKTLPGLELPPLLETFDYTRTGVAVVLQPDSAYQVRYPDEEGAAFTHHFHQPYLMLLDGMQGASAPARPGHPE